jgi:uncharacterized membrane protein
VKGAEKMQRTEFLDELQQHLSILSHEDRENILEEYRVYFTECEKEGKTEEEICDELGEPIECAKQYLGDIALEDVQTVKIDKNDGIYQLKDYCDTIALIEIKENRAKMSVFLG